MSRTDITASMQRGGPLIFDNEDIHEVNNTQNERVFHEGESSLSSFAAGPSRSATAVHASGLQYSIGTPKMEGEGDVGSPKEAPYFFRSDRNMSRQQAVEANIPTAAAKSKESGNEHVVSSFRNDRENAQNTSKEKAEDTSKCVQNSTQRRFPNPSASSVCCCSFRLSVLIVGQCVGIVGFLTMYILLYDFISNAMFFKALHNQLHVTQVGVTDAIVKPFVDALSLAASITAAIDADPTAYGLTLNASIAGDFEYCRLVETLFFGAPSVTSVMQFREDNRSHAANVTMATTSLVHAPRGGGLIKTHAGHAVGAGLPALLAASSEVFGAQPLYALPPGHWDAASLPGAVLGREASNYGWTAVSAAVDPTAPPPQTLGLQYALYFPLGGGAVSAFGHRNAWYGVVSIDPTNATLVLADVIGASDQVGALYDDRAEPVLGHPGAVLVAATIEGFTNIDQATGRPWSAEGSPWPRLNEWYALAAGSCVGLRTCDDELIHVSETRRYVGIGRVTLSATSAIVGTPTSVADLLSLMFVISASEDLYVESFRYYRFINVLFITLAAALFICVSIVVLILLTISVTQMIANFERAANLRCDEVIPHGSPLLELDDLCLHFDAMNEKLAAARAFMPAWMLLTSSSSDDDDNNDRSDVDEDDKESRTIDAAAAMSSLHASRQSLSTTGNHVPHLQDVVHRQPQHQGAGVGHPASTLSTRRVAILSMDVRGFSSAARGGGPAALAANSTALLELVADTTGAHRGVLDSFHGDHFVISFNANRTAAQPGRKAVQCGLALTDALRARLPQFQRLAMGAAMGSASVGVLGSAAQKRFSVIGACYGRALALGRASKRVEHEASVFVERAVNELAAGGAYHDDRVCSIKGSPLRLDAADALKFSNQTTDRESDASEVIDPHLVTCASGPVLSPRLGSANKDTHAFAALRKGSVTEDIASLSLSFSNQKKTPFLLMNVAEDTFNSPPQHGGPVAKSTPVIGPPVHTVVIAAASSVLLLAGATKPLTIGRSQQRCIPTNVFGVLFSEEILPDLAGLVDAAAVGFYNPRSDGSESDHRVRHPLAEMPSAIGEREATNTNERIAMQQSGASGRHMGASGLSNSAGPKGYAARPGVSRVYGAVALSRSAEDDEEADEWMYALKSAGTKSPFAALNAAAEAVFAGEWGRAADIARQRGSPMTGEAEFKCVSAETTESAVLDVEALPFVRALIDATQRSNVVVPDGHARPSVLAHQMMLSEGPHDAATRRHVARSLLAQGEAEAHEHSHEMSLLLSEAYGWHRLGKLVWCAAGPANNAIAVCEAANVSV